VFFNEVVSKVTTKLIGDKPTLYDNTSMTVSSILEFLLNVHQTSKSGYRVIYDYALRVEENTIDYD